MKLLVLQSGINQAVNPNHRKDKNFTHEFMFITKELKKYISCRIYQTRSCAYCCVYIYSQEQVVCGSAKASGHGYHRSSEAVEKAFMAAGYKFNITFGGSGDSTITAALEAVAKYNFKKGKVIEAFG